MKIIKQLVLIAIVFGMVSFSISLTVNAAMSDAIKIDSGTGTKTGVTFPHKKHLDAGLLVGKCTVCHASDAGGALKDELKKVEGFKNVFHDTCIACHKEKAKGPTACGDCHK